MIANIKRKVWRSYRFFANQNIKTPNYEFFFGNFRQLRREKVIFQFKIMRCHFFNFEQKMK